MPRPRRFLKCEIEDAARAAAENGLDAQLFPNGEIRFTARGKVATLEPRGTAEDALAGWLSNEGRAARGA